MKKYILSAATVIVLAGCGSGSGGGPEEAAQREAENTITITANNGEEGDVTKYKSYNGTGDKELNISLEREGIYVIAFAYEAAYTVDKDEDAILTVKKDGKTVKYILKKSVDDIETGSIILTRFYIEPGQSGNYSFSIDSPTNEDKWILDFAHKNDFPANLKTAFPDYGEVSKLDGNDILYEYQWHLKNTGQDSFANIGAITDEDINVEAVWSGESSGTQRTGKGIKVAVVDEGVEINHPDLVANIDIELSWNYLASSHDTSPDVADAHGTAVAGIIAAQGWNGIGGRGVAPSATIVSYNMIESQTLTSFELPLESLTRNIDKIDIYNNSWGYSNSDSGTLIENTSGSLYREFENQLQYGTTHGRPDPDDPNNTSKKRGAIYVKSAGNERDIYWNTNFNPEQVERYMIVVGASDADGMVTSYSTPGENILVSAPGGGTQSSYLQVNQQMIVTTDLSGDYQGYDNEADYDLDIYHFDVEGNENYDYTNRMNGTSSAGPIVSGVVALMLEENPNLTWRDVRYILAVTAQQYGVNRDEYDVDNLPPLSYNDDLGFGRVNASLAVALAKKWADEGTTLPDEIEESSTVSSRISSISSNPSASRTFDFSSSAIVSTDYVNVQFSIAEIEDQQTYTFTNDTNSQEIESGEYTIVFNITNAVRVIDEIEYPIDDNDVDIFINGEQVFDVIVNGGTSDKEYTLDNYSLSGGTTNVTLTFNNTTPSTVEWEMELKKGAPLPDSNKLALTLTSPSGTKSNLIIRSWDEDEEEYTNGLGTNAVFYKTRMGSSRFLNEDPKGTWTLEANAIDENGEDVGFIMEDAKVEIYGR